MQEINGTAKSSAQEGWFAMRRCDSKQKQCVEYLVGQTRQPASEDPEFEKCDICESEGQRRSTKFAIVPQQSIRVWNAPAAKAEANSLQVFQICYISITAIFSPRVFNSDRVWHLRLSDVGQSYSYSDLDCALRIWLPEEPELCSTATFSSS